MVKISKRDKKFYLTLILWGIGSIVIWIAFFIINPSIEMILALISSFQIFTFVYVWSLKNPKEENKD